MVLMVFLILKIFSLNFSDTFWFILSFVIKIDSLDRQ